MVERLAQQRDWFNNELLDQFIQ
ncbi:unnamed protein product, partial [Rotaria magnacalcarata]